MFIVPHEYSSDPLTFPGVIMASPSEPSCAQTIAQDDTPRHQIPSDKDSQPRSADQRDYDFVERPSQDFFCPVTLELLLEPQLTSCCGHHLSLEASSRLQREGKACPLCSETGWSTVLDKFHRRRVHELRVRCPHRGSGCDWVGEVNGVERHAGCCPKRAWECQYCGLKCTYGEGEGEHWPTCSKFPEPCPNGCEVGSMERCNVEQHHSVCSLELVCCEMREFGCSAVVPRKDLATHMRESELQHLTGMAVLNLQLTRQLQQDLAEKDKKIVQLQQEMAEQRQLQKKEFAEHKEWQTEMRKEMTEQRQEMKKEMGEQTQKTVTEQKKLQTEMKKELTEQRQLQVQMRREMTEQRQLQAQMRREMAGQKQEMKEEIKQLQTEMKKEMTEPRQLQVQMRREMTEQGQLQAQMRREMAEQRQLQAQMRREMAGQKQEMKEEIKQLQTEMKKEIAEQRQLQAREMAEQKQETMRELTGMQVWIQQVHKTVHHIEMHTAGECTCRYTLCKVFTFDQYCQRRGIGYRHEFYSKPFYSHQHGYKFLLRIK